MTNRGLHIILDGHNVGYNFSDFNMSSIELFLEKLLQEANMSILGKIFYDFNSPKGAFTGIFLLGESHFSIHSFPESHYISVDIYVCNLTKDVSAEARAIIESIIEYFKIQNPIIRTLER